MFHPAGALLDSGSEINFITDTLANKLQLQRKRQHFDVSGIGDVTAKLQFSVSTTIRSRLFADEWSLQFAITKTIALTQPATRIESSTWSIPDGIDLADPLFFKPQKIDILLSTQEFFKLLTGGKLSLGRGLPCLLNTTLGWIIGGQVVDNPQSRAKANVLMCKISQSQQLNENLKMFWEIESFPESSQNQYTTEEEECDRHFCKNSAFLENGRVQVRLPFSKSTQQLGNSVDIAKQRFWQIERRLQRLPDQKKCILISCKNILI